jgi:arsenite methyltransferase
MREQPGFFDFAAEVGLTKHIGGVEATEALVRLCAINKDKYVLDVGCGVGATPCFLAKTVGCRVLGVDISPRMIERAQERAAKEKLTGLVEFRVADAQDLPFEDGIFDAVLTESVTAFPEDKQKAVNEYARVTRPGGCVGLNESTWLKVPPPPEMVAWAGQDLGANVKPLTQGEWKGLLERAGLTGITAEIFTIKLQEEERGILQRYGWGGLLGILGRMLRLYARSPAYREFVKKTSKGGITPKDLPEYFGYGLFVGKKV